MKQFAFLLSICWLCSCNTLHVAQNKHAGNTPTLGVEWNYANINSEVLQKKIDSSIVVEIDKFNLQKHAFTVQRKKLRDKAKDYITIDFERVKVVGTGGKIAGYVLTAVGIAAPIYMAVTEQPLILGFYYWPNHTISSRVTLSPGLSGDKRNNKNVTVVTGALFASTDNQVEKLARKYADAFHKVLLDIETQLSQHK